MSNVAYEGLQNRYLQEREPWSHRDRAVPSGGDSELRIWFSQRSRAEQRHFFGLVMKGH